MKYVLLLWLGAALCSCLGPGAGDQTGYSSYVQDRDAPVVSLEADMPAAMKLAANAGVTGKLVQLHTAFAGGALVRYWDFGTATTTAKPIWRFRKRVSGKPDQPVDHPDLIESIPGDTSYSPLRAVYVVYVTPDYDGERITSLRALDDAVELGLLYEPKPIGKFTNCPVVPAATQLELGDGKAPLAPDVVYYHGQRTTQFCLDNVLGKAGLFTLPEKGPIMAPNAYALQRKGEPVALDEAAFAADLTGDGDQLDTNIVFAVGPTSPRYSSLWTQVSVIVPAGYSWADDRAEKDLFVKQMWGLAAISGRVEQVTPSMTLWNRPIQGVVP